MEMTTYVNTTIFQWLGTPDMHNYAINLKYERYCRSPAAWVLTRASLVAPLLQLPFLHQEDE